MVAWAMGEALFLHEQVLLLLHGPDGALEGSAVTAPFALAAAVAGDLLRLGRVRVDGDRLEPTEGAPLDNGALDGLLAALRDHPEVRPITQLARGVTAHRALVAPAGARLVALGMLELDEQTLLWVFRKVRFRERDGGPERTLRRRLGRALAAGEGDEDCCVVLGIVAALGLLPLLAEQEGWAVDPARLRALAGATEASRICGQIVAEGVARTSTRPSPQV